MRLVNTLENLLNSTSASILDFFYFSFNSNMVLKALTDNYHISVRFPVFFIHLLPKQSFNNGFKFIID